MQPVLRFSPRFLRDVNSFISATGTLRSFCRASGLPSVCLQCRIRSQRRPYAEHSKPPSSPSEWSRSQDRTSSDLSDVSLSDELPSAQAHRRSPTIKRLSHVMDNLQSNIFLASQRINDLTGYTSIEALKTRIAHLESLSTSSQTAVRTARNQYKTIVTSRSSTQREVTTLLARRDSWTPADLERFTSLYKNDHGNEQAVQEAAKELGEAEREAERIAGLLSKAILERYHEEQIWSDKIRRMSTWGTWGLMGVNVLLFLVFQFGFEPWRRRRLVGGFEEKVREALEREKERVGLGKARAGEEGQVSLNRVIAAGIEELEEEMGDAKENPDPAIDAVAACIEQTAGEEGDPPTASIGFRPREAEPRPLVRWKSAVQDLFSQRLIAVRKQDMTVIALESAAVGATLATIIATLIVRHT